MRRLWILSLVLLGCAPKPPRVVQAIAEAAAPVVFGTSQAGEPKWLSANARLVAIYTFASPIAASQACHEDAKHPPPTLTLHDTHTGDAEVIDELVATDPRGRYVITLAGTHLWLIDAETGARDDLAEAGADLTADELPCVDGRQAAFDPFGTQVLYLRTGPDRAVLRSLATGEEQEVMAPPERVWRAQPTGQTGWVRFSIVPADSDEDEVVGLPHMDHGCPGWCDPRGWSHFVFKPDGDAFAFMLAHTGGQQFRGRQYKTYGQAGIVWEAPGADVICTLQGDLQHADGRELALPVACSARATEGTEVLAIHCDGGDYLYWPATRRSLALPRHTRIDAPPVPDMHGGLWQAVVLEVDGAPRIARVDLTDGSVELGPREFFGAMTVEDASRLRPAVDRRGVALFEPYGAEQVLVYDAGTGQSWEVPDATSNRRVIHRDGQHFTLDLAGARLLPLADEPEAVAENGCVVQTAGRAEMPEGGSPRLGPWSLLCPAR